MKDIVREILSGELVPILLGYSPETIDTAHRMFRKYGVVSHVFCEKLSLSQRLSICMKFHQINKTAGQRLMLDALYDFAGQLENADVILYLIPCTERYANLVWQNRDALERCFVIADRREMMRVWFGEEQTSQQKGATV